MSAETVQDAVTRIAHLQSLLNGTPAAATGGTAAPASAFAAQLADASLATATGDDSSSDTSSLASLATATTATGAPLTTTAAATGSGSLPVDVPYSAQITAAARANGIDPALLAGLIRQESGFNAAAHSPAGAQGLTQLMPATAAGLGVSNPLDPAQSIAGGARYLAQQLDRFGGDTARALAAYNAGPGAVERFVGVPPYAETQAYVRNVQAFAASYRSRTS